MMPFPAILGVLTVVSLTISQSSALDCYSCSSTLGHKFKCENDSFHGPALPYHTCIFGDSVCAKFVIEYGDSLVIHRNCQHRDICSVLAMKHNNYNNIYSRLIDCQTCSQNYCNSGSITNIALALILTVGVVLRLL